jgi:TolA-binding protein
VHELAAEMMLEMGMAEDAAAMFEISLQRLKNRPWSLLGAARSYHKINNTQKATENYQALLAVWSDDSHAAVREAKEYLGN